MRRTSQIALGLALASLVIGSVLMSSSGSAEPGPNPGLPLLVQPEGYPPPGNLQTQTWLNFPQAGLASSVAAKQWARLPLGVIATSTVFSTCGAADQPNACTDPTDLPNRTGSNRIASQIFLVSPVGDRVPYGNGPIATTRTVTFGSLPAEADVQIRQSRDGDDLPEPLQARTTETYYLPDPNDQASRRVRLDAQLDGAITVAVTALRVDGRDIGLSRDCSTSETALHARADRYEGQDTSSYDPRRSFYGLSGGSFRGRVDIPAFQGCTTVGGDDVSRLLTATLSGPDNPFLVTTGAGYCFKDFFPPDETGTAYAKPANPGDDTPTKAACPQFQQFPDQNPDNYTIPRPPDIPDRDPAGVSGTDS